MRRLVLPLGVLVLFLQLSLRPAWGLAAPGPEEVAVPGAEAVGTPAIKGEGGGALKEDAEAPRGSAAGGEILINLLSPPGGEAWLNDVHVIQVGQVIHGGDQLRTAPGTSVELLFLPSARVWIGPNSNLRVGDLSPEGATVLELLGGAVRATLAHLGLGESPLVIQTESVLAAPRGTDFAVERRGQRAVGVAVLEGAVRLTQLETGEVVDLGEGEEIVLSLDAAWGEVRGIPLEDATWGGVLELPVVAPSLSQLGPVGEGQPRGQPGARGASERRSKGGQGGEEGDYEGSSGPAIELPLLVREPFTVIIEVP